MLEIIRHQVVYKGIGSLMMDRDQRQRMKALVIMMELLMEELHGWDQEILMYLQLH